MASPKSESEIVKEYMDTMLYVDDQPDAKPMDWLWVCHDYIHWRYRMGYGDPRETFRLRTALIEKYGAPEPNWSRLHSKAGPAGISRNLLMRS